MMELDRQDVDELVRLVSQAIEQSKVDDFDIYGDDGHASARTIGLFRLRRKVAALLDRR